MKITRTIASLFVFLVCLIVGFWVGFQTPDTGKVEQRFQEFVPEAIPVTTRQPVQTPANLAPLRSAQVANGQRSILIVGVDQLDAPAPRLESLWLVAYFPDTPRLTLLPVYPTTLAGGRSSEEKLVNAFRLNSDGSPDAGFLDLLSFQDLWWSNYVVLDRKGLTELVNLAGVVDLGQGTADSPQLVASVPAPWDDPLASHYHQVNLLLSLCQATRHAAAGWDPGQIFDLLALHTITDLDLASAIPEGLALISSGSGLSCDFPTLRNPLP